MGTAFRTYEAARAEAQKRANETGETYGLEIFTLMGTEYVIRQLPKLRNRYGCDLRCETIEPSLTATQALKAAGFVHANRGLNAAHDIYDAKSGEIVAQLHASEIWAWLARLPRAHEASPVLVSSQSHDLGNRPRDYAHASQCGQRLLAGLGVSVLPGVLS